MLSSKKWSFEEIAGDLHDEAMKGVSTTYLRGMMTWTK